GRSATASAATKDGSIWYCACTRSGGFPAVAAVRNLAAASSPPACLFTVTWMSGLAAFQTSAILSMLGAQVQYVSVTGPAEVEFSSSEEVEPSEPPEHPASTTASIAAVTAASRVLVIRPSEGSRPFCERSQTEILVTRCQWPLLPC